MYGYKGTILPFKKNYIMVALARLFSYWNNQHIKLGKITDLLILGSKRILKLV